MFVLHLPAFPVLTIFLAFILWATVKRKLAEQEEKKKTDAFWEREYAANQVRKKDLSNLDYIKIQTSRLPIKSNPPAGWEQTILELADQPIVNLNEYTNTDLKLKYGVANLEYLSVCDQNYVTLIKTMYEWGKELYEQGNVTDALTVLEEGIQYGTDIRGHYTLLASIYQEQGKNFMIEELIRRISQTNSPMKDSILRGLNSLMKKAVDSSDSP